MSKVQNKNAEEADSGNCPSENETLELNSRTIIKHASLPKAGKDGAAILKPASQTGKVLQKSNFASQIGESLQNAYNDILQQPVPDRFLELLRQLESDQPKPSPGSKKDNQ